MNLTVNGNFSEMSFNKCDKLVNLNEFGHMLPKYITT